MVVGAAKRSTSGDTSFDVRCLEWLQTDEAERSAKRVIRRAGLPLDPFELVSEATVKILTKVRTDPDVFAQEQYSTAKVDGYCSMIMRNYVYDLLRGIQRDRDTDRLLEADHRNDTDVFAVPDSTESERVVMGAVAAERVDGLRIAAEYSGAKETVVSGALTVWALQRDPDADIGVAPTPLAGATPEQARLWPAIWFAGFREKAFPSSGESSQAQQKYRSRIAKQIREFLQLLEVRDEVDPS